MTTPNSTIERGVTEAREILKKHAALYGDKQYEPSQWVIDAMIDFAQSRQPSPAQAEPTSLWANLRSIKAALTGELGVQTRPYLYAEKVAIDDIEFLIGKPTGAAEGAEPTADATLPIASSVDAIEQGLPPL